MGACVRCAARVHEADHSFDIEATEPRVAGHAADAIALAQVDWKSRTNQCIPAREEHREIQVVVTAAVTAGCHPPPDGDSEAARAGSEAAGPLGRAPPRRGAQAGADSEGSASPAAAARNAVSVSRHTEGATGAALAADAASRPRARAQLRRGARARTLPRRALLDPERSRPPDRGGARLRAPGLGHEVDRCAVRASREPGVRTPRPRARRPLPPPHPPDAARGEERAGLCPPQRPAPRREARAADRRCRTDRPRVLRALVRRLACARSARARSARGRRAAHLAAANRLAASRARRSGGGAGRHSTPSGAEIRFRVRRAGEASRRSSCAAARRRRPSRRGARSCRRAEKLLAFTCLAGQRSGDIYTASDLALLAALAERCSEVIARLDAVACEAVGVATGRRHRELAVPPVADASIAIRGRQGRVDVIALPLC